MANPIRVALVVALAAGMSHSDAAQAAGVSEKTIQRELQRPEFAELVRRARDELIAKELDKVDGVLNRVVTLAFETLVGLMSNGDDAIKLKATAVALDHSLKLDMRRLTVERVAALERDRGSGGVTASDPQQVVEVVPTASVLVASATKGAPAPVDSDTDLINEAPPPDPALKLAPAPAPGLAPKSAPTPAPSPVHVVGATTLNQP